MFDFFLELACLIGIIIYFKRKKKEKEEKQAKITAESYKRLEEEEEQQAKQQEEYRKYLKLKDEIKTLSNKYHSFIYSAEKSLCFLEQYSYTPLYSSYQQNPNINDFYTLKGFLTNSLHSISSTRVQIENRSYELKNKYQQENTVLDMNWEEEAVSKITQIRDGLCSLYDNIYKIPYSI